MAKKKRAAREETPLGPNEWDAASIELPLLHQLLAVVLTAGLFNAYWVFKRQFALEALPAPRPVPAALAYAAAGSLAVASFLVVAYDERLLVIGLYLVALAWEDRVLRLLQWRFEELGVRFRPSYGALLLFRTFYVQHQMNRLVALEQELAEAAAGGQDEDAAEDEDEDEDPDEDGGRRERLPNRVFWQLVDQIDHEALTAGDHEAALAPLREALLQLEPAEIEGFAETLAHKLHAFDGPMFVEAGGEASATSKGFLWARCHVVAQGQETYRAVLASPELMPRTKAERCAALLRVAPAAYEEATGEAWTYEASEDVRRGSNTALWQGHAAP